MTLHDDVVELSAIAICEQGAVPCTWESRSEHQKRCYRDDARAALEAARYGEMREALHKASGEIKVVRMHMLQRGRLWNALGDIEDALLSAIGEPDND